MRVYQEYFTDKDGKRKKTSKWYLDFADHLGRRHRIPGFTEKRQTERLGNNIEALLSCKIAGQMPDGNLQQWIETLPNKLLKKLTSIGLVHVTRSENRKILMEHLADWKKSLLAEENTSEYANLQYNRAKKIMTGCNFVTWTDISASKIQDFIKALKDIRIKKVENSEGKLEPVEIKKPVSKKTKNYHLQAVKQFCKWMKLDNRATIDPVSHLQPVTVFKSDENTRAALEHAETVRLIQAANNSGVRYNIEGSERALVYRFAAETGLRAKEIRSLGAFSFDFNDLTVKVIDKESKNRKETILPLRADTAEILKNKFRGKLPNAPAFRLPSKYNMAKMLRSDLKAARTAWLKEAEHNPQEYEIRKKSDFLKPIKNGNERVDFHSLRHTFGTLLASSGVNPKVSQELMRHSDINLTMSRYTHTVRGQLHRAVDDLPDLPLHQQQEIKATGTDDMTPAVASSQPNSAIYSAKSLPEHRTNTQSFAKVELIVERPNSPILNQKAGFQSQKANAPEGIRTPDLRIRNPLLYPAELRAQNVVSVGGENG